MTIAVWECDRCGKEFREKQGGRIVFHVDDHVDAGQDIKILQKADFCANCQLDLIEQILSDITIQRREELAKEWGAK